jgi:hypothetical protein
MQSPRPVAGPASELAWEVSKKPWNPPEIAPKNASGPVGGAADATANSEKMAGVGANVTRGGATAGRRRCMHGEAK